MSLRQRRVDRGLAGLRSTLAHAVDRDGHRLRKTQHVARSLGDGGTLDRTAYQIAFGVEIEEDYGAVLDRLTRAGVLERSEDGYAMTSAGALVHDLVTLSFYPSHSQEWLREREPLEVAVGAR